MACSNCNTPNCGCSGTYVVSQTCPPACSEVFNSACIVYTGVDLTCANSQTGLVSTVVNRNDYLDDALTKIVRFICDRANEALTSTIVTTVSQPYLSVTPSLVGSVTTFSVDLDIDAVAAAVDGNTTVVEAGGTNVTVDETVVGSVTTYTVTAQGTDVVSGDDFIDVSVTQVGDDDVVTLTLDINEVEDALGEVSVAQGTSDHVVVTTVNNFPTTGDTQYRLDTISTDVVSTDPILTVVTTPGIAPLYDQVFTLDLDDALLSQFVMDTLNQTGGLGSIGLQEGTGIALNYDPSTYTMVISSTVTDPVRWLSLIDDFGAFLDPSLGTSTLSFLGDGGLVSGGFDGISATLNANPAAAELQLVNTDPGSGQLIFGFCQASNGGVITDPACAATDNTDTLTLDGGDDITLTAVGNTITINNDIDAVYGTIIGEDLVNLLAPTSSASLSIVGVGVTTSGSTAGPINELTITNDALVYSTITGDTGSSPASGFSETLAIVSSGAGCSTTVTADTVTIENTGVTSAVAGDGIAVSAATGAVTVSSTDALVVLRDMNILGGVVQFPSDNATTGECDVTAAGINSNFMQVQIVDQATGTIQDITGGAVAGIGLVAGIFSVAGAPAAGFADGNYRIIVTGNRV